MIKTVFTGFSPNMTIEDISKALGYLFLPWKWFQLKDGREVERVENWFKDFLNIKNAFVFDSGRYALYFSLRALGIKKGDEVVVPGYTCVVVSNAVRWAGAKPVYVDIKDDLNIDSNKLEAKITDDTKAIVLQHTFGLPADIEEIKSIAQKENIKIIEDCAHSLGAKYKGRQTGTFGDVSIFSFGSNKVISSVRGGLAATNNDQIAKKLKNFQKGLPVMETKDILKHLLYYPFFSVGKTLYSLKIGKWFLAIARKLHLLASIIYPEEKQGKQRQGYPVKYPNVLADILLGQLHKLDNFNLHREKLAKIYENKLPKNLQVSYNIEGKDRIYLDYPILVKNPQKLLNLAKKQGFVLSLAWSGSNIVPEDSDREEVGYKEGECSKAEKLSQQVVQLPTNIHTKEHEAQKLADIMLKITK